MNLLLPFILCCITSLVNAQTEDHSVDLSEYLVIRPGSIFVYDCTFESHFNGEFGEVIDTIILKEGKNKGESYLYFFENKPPYFSISTNSFISGAFRIKDENFEYLPLEYERELPISEKDGITLFPVEIKFQTFYESRSLYDNPVFYLFTKTPEDSVILLEKVTQYDSGKVEIDSVWIKKEVGIVRYLRSTGRNEVLSKHWYEEPEEKIPSGPVYTSNNGIRLRESELSGGELIQSDFSTAIYDNDCFLIKETFYGSNGEIGIKYITYEYGDDGRLLKELCHYSGRLGPTAEARLTLSSEYSYFASGNIKAVRKKLNSNDDNYFRDESYSDSDNHSIEMERYSLRHPLNCIKRSR